MLETKLATRRLHPSADTLEELGKRALIESQGSQAREYFDDCLAEEPKRASSIANFCEDRGHLRLAADYLRRAELQLPACRSNYYDQFERYSDLSLLFPSGYDRLIGSDIYRCAKKAESAPDGHPSSYPFRTILDRFSRAYANVDFEDLAELDHLPSVVGFYDTHAVCQAMKDFNSALMTKPWLAIPYMLKLLQFSLGTREKEALHQYVVPSLKKFIEEEHSKPPNGFKLQNINMATECLRTAMTLSTKGVH